MKDVDVLIVGGGPAGLTAASRAAARCAVLVVHKDKEFGRPVRTSGGSWKKDLERLGVPPHLYDAIDEAAFHSSHESAVFKLGDTGRGANDNPPVILDTAALYTYLAAKARAAGAQIECSARFISTRKTSDNKYISRVKQGGKIVLVKSRLIIDASGHYRAVLVDQNLAPPTRRAGVGVEYEFEVENPKRRITLFLGTRYAPSGYGWIFPVKGNRIRIGIGVIRPDTDTNPKTLLDAFMKSKKYEDWGYRIGKRVAVHGGVIPSDGPLRRFVYGNIISVGDSGGQVLALLGEGIRYVMEAGYALGDAIASGAADRENAAKYLEAYEKDWLKANYATFALALKFNRRISAYDDREWDRSIRRIAAMSQKQVVRKMRMELGPPFMAVLVLKIIWPLYRLIKAVINPFARASRGAIKDAEQAH